MTAIAEYFALNYIPQPKTAFKNIQHLSPANMAIIDKDNGLRTVEYWNLGNVVAENDMTEAEATSKLLSILDDATRLRLRCDSKFGAFLSGGLDSSSVVGFMSVYKPDNLRTYSIGFDDERFDETNFAKQASRLFSTSHQNTNHALEGL